MNLKFVIDMMSMDKLLLILLFYQSIISGAYYHLASQDSTCLVPAQENKTVDVVCQIWDTQKGGKLCHVTDIHWVRIGIDGEQNVTDTTKYGTWTLSDWGMREGEHITLLRIRNFQTEDIGRYRCHSVCMDDDGRTQVLHHQSDVCMHDIDEHHAICGTRMENRFCATSFQNGVCDKGCDKEDYLFDGHDCSPPPILCPADIEHKCAERFADGVCNQECNRQECAFDGGDCITTPLIFADDTLVFRVSKWYLAAGQRIPTRQLGRTLSLFLRTIIRVLPDSWAKNHRHKYYKRDVDSGYVHNGYLGSDEEVISTFYIKVDNTNCRDRCFKTADSVAQYLTLALRKDFKLQVPISTVGVLKDTSDRCPLENNTMLAIQLSSHSNNPEYKVGYRGNTGASQDFNNGSHTEIWILVSGILGGICIMILALAIIFVAVRVHRMKRGAYSDATHIRVNAEVPHGTQV